MTRDIARNRKVYHSSAYDKNLCGHLVTSGNPEDRPKVPAFKFATQYADDLTKMAYLIDEQNTTYWFSLHKSTYFDVIFDHAVSIQAYRLYSNLYDQSLTPTEWRLSGTNDGIHFEQLDYRKYDGSEMRYGVDFQYSYFTEDFILPVKNARSFRIFRMEILNNNGSEQGVALGEFDLISADNQSLLRNYDGHFEQCWKSKGNQEEYLLLDLGAVSDASKVILNWGEEYAVSYELLSSLDGEKWNSCYKTNRGIGGIEQLDLPIKARYLKLLMHKAAQNHYVLRQWSVIGENDLPEKKSKWKLVRASEVSVSGTEISTLGFDDTKWFPAVVPGTVLTSYMEADAVCEYNEDDNYKQHSDAFFTTNWWYRTKFKVDDSKKGKRIWLNFDAINWKADIYLNGQWIGDIQGAFIRKKIDVTSYVKYGEDNCLAVLIHCNDFPGPQKGVGIEFPYFINGGVTGLDEPCLAAGIGWDWIATVSGRNIGIYKDVYLTYTEDVQLLDPWFETEKIDYSTGSAELVFRTEVSNASSKTVAGVLTCSIDDGLYEFSKEIVLKPSQKNEIVISDLLLENARLWYPVGYGLPELYKADIRICVNGTVSDEKTFEFGVRVVDYLIDADTLALTCNGKKICCVGGNWGMDDANMRNTPRDYDIKVRMHADMHFNMIRNWVGQTNDEAFYAACDRYGVMVWDDFWLANPVDGPDPLDVDMFMANAEDKIRKVRKHPSVVVYCARNEGYPVEPLDTLLPALVEKMDPKRLYVPHSAAGIVSGYGPYRALEKAFYFTNTEKTLHTERGIPNIPVLESVQKFLYPEHQWPICDTWVTHAFIYNGAQHCGEFCERLQNLYGAYDSLEEFVRKSQMLCYESYKAIFEAERAADGGGMILWMSSPAMPSFAFQTYDYYYAINAGFMGAKLANQPLYAYHNPITKKIVLDNRSGSTAEHVSLLCQMFEMQGKLLWEKNVSLDSCGVGQYDITVLENYDNTVFLRTVVCVGEKCYRNFEWIYPDRNGTVGLETLQTAKIAVRMKGNTITVQNISDVPALQISLTLRNTQTNERVLPVFWSDNFISLMPGDTQVVEYKTYDAIENDNTACCVSGFNVDKFVIGMQ